MQKTNGNVTSRFKPSQALSTNNQSSISLKNLQFQKKFGLSKFPAYLVYSPETNQSYVLKTFPYQEGAMRSAYINEVRFRHLRHPNIISMIACIDKQKARCKNDDFLVSYILMEHASIGDLADFMIKHEVLAGETLARTFFHQLIEGLEYLHRQGIAHLDIKLENLLLTEDFTLKIADFDLSYMEGDSVVRGKGTVNYRSPEIREAKCKNPKASDIYSAAIVLFTMASGGYPYVEGKIIEGRDVWELMMTRDEAFWTIHEKARGEDQPRLSAEFKDLFFKMTCLNPEERLTIQEIKEHKWYKGTIYTREELREKCF